MNSEREVFIAALMIDGEAARAEYLDRVCATDVPLRTRLNDLLKHHGCEHSVLETPVQDMMEPLGVCTPVMDVAPENATVILNALQPFLEATEYPAAIGRLGQYELLEILGQGGYGSVFKAHDNRLNRLVAIKILSPLLAVTSPPRRRFLREARAAAAVQHENVVQIYGVEESPIPYLVMEYVSGETLQQRSDRLGPFDPAEIVRLGQQIARGLEAAHAKGLIHRDIKPGNILLEHGGELRAKLSDFGLARTVDDASLSQSGVVIGTPMYMSPEQVHGDELDQRADLFSLGSVLYLMATGRPPFRAASTMAVLKRVVEDHPRSITDIVPEIPYGLSRVIRQLHAKSPGERYASASQVDEALQLCLAETAPRRWGTIGRRRAVLTAASLLLVGLGAWGIVTATGWNGSQERRVVETVYSATQATAGQSAQMPEALEVAPDTPQMTEWDRRVARMSAPEQEVAVRARLLELNPALPSSSIQFTSEQGIIRSLEVDPSNELDDLSPARALRGLTLVRLFRRDIGRLVDLSPLQGLLLKELDIVGHPITDLTPLRGMPLKSLGVWFWAGDDLSPLRGMRLINANFGGNPHLRDLEPLRGMAIEQLCLNMTPVEDLSPLEGMPLRRLEIQETNVKSIQPIASGALEYLAASQTPITDFSPLQGTPIQEVHLDYMPARDEAVLRSLRTLRTVNNRPLPEFLAQP